MKKYNKLSKIALMAAICLVAAGCGKSQTISENTVNNEKSKAETSVIAKSDSKTPTEETTINFWHHYSAQSPENETLTNILIPKFEEENPGIKVNAVSHEWADLHDKILISAKSDTLPDVARLDSAWIPEFQKMGILVPLNKEMADFKDVATLLLDMGL